MENKNKEELLNTLDELIYLIKNMPNYKRYIELKKKMSNNNEIMNIIRDIKKIEQSIVKKEYNKLDFSDEEKSLSTLKSKLKEYPIYLEYSYLQEDLNNDFQNIKKIIENSFNY